MAGENVDYTKQDKYLYMPGTQPTLVDVPDMVFVAVDGTGDPDGPVYQNALGVLYALSWTIKMSEKSGENIPGFYPYKVAPLEGLWEGTPGGMPENRDTWRWRSLIRQPEFVTQTVFDWALEQVQRKKPELNTEKAELIHFKEGLCVQAMHKGPYATEPETLKKIQEYMRLNNLKDETGTRSLHHEIYLGDPRKTKPQNLKTVLRHPVSRLSQ